ncbi:aromatic amino acid lyase [Streptomyces aureus]|uniref:aromatic amino acid lyase n=1 Tax=Streptomyces aureus TaxID=193461 RepID=UPI003409EAFF
MLERTADAATGGPVTEHPVTESAPPGTPLDGRGLDAATVARVADGAEPPALSPVALAAMEHTRRAAERLAAEGARVYGRSTGVGAHRGLQVEEYDGAGHDLRLLLSHAGGAGAALPARQVRAMMVVRANQLLAAGSGLGPEIPTALAAALRAAVHPRVPEYGSVGTGDLTALARLGLAMFGHDTWTRDRAGSAGRFVDGLSPERPVPERPVPESLPLRRGDALALLSSNALTLGQAALAWHDLGVPLRAAHVVAALSLCAVDGSLEPYAPEVHAAHPHPSTARAAARVRQALGASTGDGTALLGGTVPPEAALLGGMTEPGAALLGGTVPPGRTGQGQDPVPTPVENRVPAGVEKRMENHVQDRVEKTPPARVQDPFGFRCFPQAHGPAMEAWSGLERVLSIDLNSATENPLIGWDDRTGAPAALHHGGFFTAPLTLALDQLGLAVLGTARLSAARLSALGRPGLTGLRSYLADSSSAGSGMMILEYSATSALAEIQACATPAALGHAVLSQGMEEAATFSTQAARKSLRAAEPYRLVLACELVAAVRALRLRGTAPVPGTPAGRAYLRAAAALDPDMRDRPLTDDVTTAAALLDGFAELDGDT